jgi:CheY-like chemotaxis protein
MTPDVVRRAFEPFFTTKDVGKGTGLGLAQIYGFVKQSGGVATIDSAVGRGTTVSLHLPRAPAASRAEPVAVPAPARHRRGHGKTILLVEDQADVREVVKASLSGLGYRVLTAPDGPSGLRILEGDEPIDLLLTDVVMPNGMTGIELAQDARRLRQDIRIVVISGYFKELQAGVPLAGVVFLKKPFMHAELAEKIETALTQP